MAIKHTKVKNSKFEKVTKKQKGKGYGLVTALIPITVKATPANLFRAGRSEHLNKVIFIK